MNGNRQGEGKTARVDALCEWCLAPLVAGRCSHCGKKPSARGTRLKPSLATRMAARMQRRAADRRRQADAAHQLMVRPAWYRPRPQRRGRFAVLAGAALVAWAAYGVAWPDAERLLAAWGSCDLCGMYVAQSSEGCERFFIDDERPNHAIYLNTCGGAMPPSLPPVHEQVYRVHRHRDGNFGLVPVQNAPGYQALTFTKLTDVDDQWVTDSPARVVDGYAGVFRREMLE